MSKNIVSQNVVVIPESVKDQLKKEVSEAFPGVVVTVNNLNIWVSGDTKPIKDELKAFGFKWASKRKAWFMRVPESAKPEAEAEPEESEQMKAIRAMLEQYKDGNISFDEYMTKQKAICSECSARIVCQNAGGVAPAEPEFVRTWYVREYEGDPLGKEIPSMLTFAEVYENPQDVYELIGVADSVIRERIFHKLVHLYGVEYNEIYNRWLGEPASVCSIAERPQKQIAGYLPAPKPRKDIFEVTEEDKAEFHRRLEAAKAAKELTEDQQKLVNYYREYAKHLRSVTVCFENVKNFLNGWQKPINKTFVDRMLELINGISEREGMGKFYASWNCYNPKQLNAYYSPSNSYHYSIAGLSLLVESKTQKLTAEGKKILLETIDENIKHQADRAEQYERMADSYAEYLEAKKQRDDAIAEANEAFNANKTFTDCETDAQYNSNYGKYNYLF